MKPIELQGAVAAATRPLRLRRYEPGQLPDPGACVDSLIVVNDRSTPGSAGLRVSDGSSWLDPGAAQPQSVDVTPIVREAVHELLPALLARPAAPALSAPPPDDVRAIAGHLLQMVDTVNDLAHRLAEAEARVEFLERTALGRAEIKGAP
jgi:hypothetical protein